MSYWISFIKNCRGLDLELAKLYFNLIKCRTDSIDTQTLQHLISRKCCCCCSCCGYCFCCCSDSVINGTKHPRDTRYDELGFRDTEQPQRPQSVEFQNRMPVGLKAWIASALFPASGSQSGLEWLDKPVKGVPLYEPRTRGPALGWEPRELIALGCQLHWEQLAWLFKAEILGINLKIIYDIIDCLII